ncbi:hypothetical protein [Methylotenera sp. 1P/1]|uniref:hypothetical protein n=1 Tax=Methylotenera sp. 1P/1 TaxID=1131551 RepID=UPI00037C8060|nr:hypothetical protein [Methylotenera sp. 1P/1]
MSFSTHQELDLSLSKFTLNQISSSLLSVLPIYKQLALDNLTDEEIPSNARAWITYIDIFAIQNGQYGYFDCDGVLEQFETKLIETIYSFKTHNEIKQFIIDLFLFECKRIANLKRYIFENNSYVVEF